jgi:mycothiol synthase
MADEEQVELCFDLERGDVAWLRPVIARVEEQGIVISTLAEEHRRDPESLARLYALAQVVHRSPNWTLEEYLTRFDRWEAVFIARLGSSYVGYSYLIHAEQHLGRLQQCMTGVRPECRRQGIATALKARGIAYARQVGARIIVTRVHPTNEASLAMNRKMGFS